MEFSYSGLKFEVVNDRVLLKDVYGFTSGEGYRFCEIQVAGENKVTHAGVKMTASSEGSRLLYTSHRENDGNLEIVMRSPCVEAKVIFTAYPDCRSFRAKTVVTNIKDEPIVLEEVSAFTLYGVGSSSDTENIELTRFSQSHHGECQPITDTFAHLGFLPAYPQNQKKVSFCNVGSWSTKEALPQCIINDKSKGQMMMYQIECNNSWYYEIALHSSVAAGHYYVYLGGPNSTNGGWSKKLLPGESYETVSVSFAFGGTLNEVIGEMTKHRRHFAGKCTADEDLPAIFNEYMHLSWDGPEERNVRKYAPAVAKTGVEYYVIDCGWHDECDPSIIYHYVGKWRESNARFPSGVKATLDYIKSLGMKPGLWIEPESIGWKSEILDYYDDDTCFLCRHGKPVVIHNRRFADLRHPKVAAYLTETIRYMVEDLGAEYIKLDYNQDCAIGTDVDAYTPSEGLERSAKAYLEWIDSIRKRFPNVLFETCSSGGMRMDYETLSHFSIISTSDQVSYYKYPCIVGNVSVAVLPEQAAVWSYPVDSRVSGFQATSEWVNANVSDEQIIMNMINSFLGRIHLASHLELFNEEKFALVTEGIQYYNRIKVDKKKALPYLPIGFTNFGKTLVASGLKTDDKIYLAVWNLNGEREVEIPLPDVVAKGVKVAYPASNTVDCKLDGNTLKLSFTEDLQARMLEIDI